MNSTIRRVGAVLVAATAAVVGAGAAGAHTIYPTQGDTVLRVSAAATQGFVAAGISASVPASFPVVKGSEYSFHALEESDAGGTLLHEGAITLAKGYTVVTLEDPVVEVNGGDNPNGSLQVTVGGGRATIATLDLTEYEPSEGDPGFTGARALLTPEAAALLNQTFETDVFAGGLELGSLSTSGVAQPVRFTKQGRTVAKLNRKAVKLLKANKVKLKRTGAAKGKGRKAVFPIKGGRFDLVPFSGPGIKHRGGLKFGSYRTGGYRLRYEAERGFVIRSGAQKGLALFTVGFGPKTTFGLDNGRMKVGKADLFVAIEAARDLAPALGLKPAALAQTKIGAVTVKAPYVDLGR